MSKRTSKSAKLSALVAQFESLDEDAGKTAGKTLSRTSSSVRGRDGLGTGRQSVKASTSTISTTSARAGDAKPSTSTISTTSARAGDAKPGNGLGGSDTPPARRLVSRRSQSIVQRMAMFDSKDDSDSTPSTRAPRMGVKKSDSVVKGREKFQEDTPTSGRSTGSGRSSLASESRSSASGTRTSSTRTSRRTDQAVASQGDSTPSSSTEVARSDQPASSSASSAAVGESGRFNQEKGTKHGQSPRTSVTGKQVTRDSSNDGEDSPRSSSPASVRRRRSPADDRTAKAKKASPCDSPLSSSPTSRRKRPSTGDGAPAKTRKSSISDSPTSRRRKSSTDEGIATGKSGTPTGTDKSSATSTASGSRKSSVTSTPPASRKTDSASGSRKSSVMSTPPSSRKTEVARRKSSTERVSGRSSTGSSPTSRRRRSSSADSQSSLAGAEPELDFDDVQTGPLLESSAQAHRVTVAPRGRRKATQNPVKALQNREDVLDELKPSADQIGKAVFNKSAQLAGMNISLATSSLAGLAAREDVTAVKLSSVADAVPATVWPKQLLIHIKGRRVLQTRLAEPVASSVNSGDSFILIDSEKRALFQFIGKSANVIERAKSADMATDILHGKDCGSKATKTTVVEEGKVSSRGTEMQFWTALTGKEEKPASLAAEAGDDITVEKELISKTVVYEVQGEGAVVCPNLCGKSIKYAMCDPKKVMIFDFVNEVVSWTGRRAPNGIRKLTGQVAKEVFDRGYIPKEGGSAQGKRPPWALLIACKDGSETILFRSKVTDWPDGSKVIKTSAPTNPKSNISKSTVLKACDVKRMVADHDAPYPGLIALQRNLGRGSGEAPSDDPCLPGAVVKTESVKKWKIKDNTCLDIDDVAMADFFEEDAYIVRWEYSLHSERSNIKSGVQSKQIGSNQNIYFYWQGAKCRIAEKGTAALIVVELSGSEGDPQIRVAQGSEPPAFLQMFNGGMAVHAGRSEAAHSAGPRLYGIHGALEQEVHLQEIVGPLAYKSLRSRNSFIVADPSISKLYLWHGKNSAEPLRSLAIKTAEMLAERQGSANGYSVCDTQSSVREVEEGGRCAALGKLLPGYDTDKLDDEGTMLSKKKGPRMFRFTVATGAFDSLPQVRQWRYAGKAVAFPADQSSFYDVDQPAIGMVEAGDTLYVWCGWMREAGEDDRSVGGMKSSWLERKKLAFKTASSYLAEMKRNGSSDCRGLVVTAGHEPVEFRSLFLRWQDSEEAKQAVQKVTPCSQLEPIALAAEIEAMAGVTYPLDLLRSKPLPDNLDVDPKYLEKYLSESDFEVAFSMAREAFDKQPAWKQLQLRKKSGLF